VSELPTLGVLAGGGRLPIQVATAARAAGRQVFIVGLEGFAVREFLEGWPHEIIRIGAAGRIIQALREHGCRDLVLIGPVRRPSLLDIRPDTDGVKILGRIGRAAFLGDDGLLAAVIKIFGEEGFRVIGAQDVLRTALGPTGLLTTTGPDAQAVSDIERGLAVVRALGAVDVGQACVIQQGMVLAVEAAEGTDAMLARCKALARDGIGGVLVKLVKPGQERRADLPTIGPETIRGVATAGLRGVAFEGGGTILAEREASIASANTIGLFLIGLDQQTIQEGRLR
jgi:UDP-2,3-diacylglucosamine hydrolase